MLWKIGRTGFGRQVSEGLALGGNLEEIIRVLVERRDRLTAIGEISKAMFCNKMFLLSCSRDILG